MPDRLEFGTDLSSWPQEKLRHAEARSNELVGILNTWLAGRPVFNELTPSADLTRIDMRLRVRSQPPLRHMSLILGDVLHALRSSLDSLAWEVAHLNGAKPKRKNAIYFPTCSTEQDWESKASALQTWPATALARVREIQPFLLDDPWSSPLAWLHELNRVEKHRHLIEARLGAVNTQVNFEAFMNAGTTVSMHTTEDQVDLVDGFNLGHIAIVPAAREIEPQTTSMSLSFDVHVGDSRVGLPELLSGLLIETGSALAITAGQVTADAPRQEVKFERSPSSNTDR